MKNWIKEKIPGIVLCLVISVPAWFLGKYLPMIGSPVFAILIGMVASMIYKQNQRTKDGVKFVSKKILQYAVILLGFGMNLTVIASVGLFTGHVTDTNWVILATAYVSIEGFTNIVERLKTNG